MKSDPTLSNPPDQSQDSPTARLAGSESVALPIVEPEIDYHPVPHPEPGARPVWRVRLELAHDPSRCLGLDINDDVRLGRGDESLDLVSLSLFDAEGLGVSRSHLLLRPTDTHLYVLDTGSTNGTWRNGQSIGLNVPHSLSHGDLLRLGELELVVRIVGYPASRAQAGSGVLSKAARVTAIAHALTSQLDLDEVLRKAIDLAISETGADEVSIWLVDERIGDLYLEADRGIQDARIRRMRLEVSDTLAGKVIETGRPVRVSSVEHNGPVKVKTGYLVNAVLYVPLTLGGVTFGVLLAAHRKPDASFDDADEKILQTIGDFTAVAVRNARSYQAATSIAARRDKIVTALNNAHSRDFRNLIDSLLACAARLESYHTLDTEAAGIIQQISSTSGQMSGLIAELDEISLLSDSQAASPEVCDLLALVGQAVSDVRPMARKRAITVDLQSTGTPYPILGDPARLHRGIMKLIEYGVICSPEGSPVFVLLHFAETHVSVHVHDSGPAISPDDAPYVFETYSRTRQASGHPPGADLNLALVWAAVEAHRGRVEARSAGDDGAEFVITLPAALRLIDDAAGAA